MIQSEMDTSISQMDRASAGGGCRANLMDRVWACSVEGFGGWMVVVVEEEEEDGGDDAMTFASVPFLCVSLTFSQDTIATTVLNTQENFIRILNTERFAADFC